MHYRNDLTQADVVAGFRYSKRTGKLIRLANGNECVNLNSNGHIQLKFMGAHYLAHRLIWLYVTGAWPKAIIDHKNGIKTDNRWTNLREATYTTNAENRRKAHSHSSTGVMGVFWSAAHGKWRAQICHKYKKIHLGLHDTPDAAHKAYLKAKRKIHAGSLI